MTGSRSSPFAEFFFLPGARGELFAAFHQPPEGMTKKGGILYVPPFAEELNKSRRMSTVQARYLAWLGYSVLIVDLYGSGDSDGEFGDATWDIWIEDLVASFNWLSEQTGGQVSVWAMRLGTLLAMDLMKILESAIPKLVFWQPVVSGEAALTEFLRVQLAGEMLGGKAASTTLQDLRARLNAGESLEIGGYSLNQGLAQSISSASLTTHTPAVSELHWLEVSFDKRSGLGASSQRLVDSWREQGVPIRARVVEGPRFWSTTEITDCPPLLVVTQAAMSGHTQ